MFYLIVIKEVGYSSSVIPFPFDFAFLYSNFYLYGSSRVFREGESSQKILSTRIDVDCAVVIET